MKKIRKELDEQRYHRYIKGYYTVRVARKGCFNVLSITRGGYIGEYLLYIRMFPFQSFIINLPVWEVSQVEL